MFDNKFKLVVKAAWPIFTAMLDIRNEIFHFTSPNALSGFKSRERKHKRIADFS